jgi:photosystem II stability/assembly factor-like uncharacterized protein
MDRVPGGPFDTHTLGTHKLAPGRLYSAAGDGYYESEDHGQTWERPDSGLRHQYVYGIAVDSRDPELVIVSAASGPWHAHSPTGAESFVYRRIRGEKWDAVRVGLPEPSGTVISSLVANPFIADEFYAANSRGLFHSADGGTKWDRLEIPWSSSYVHEHAWGIDLAKD